MLCATWGEYTYSLISVTISTGVLDREIPPLAATARYFGIKEALVITTDEERTVEHEGTTVRVVPAWRWLAGA